MSDFVLDSCAVMAWLKRQEPAAGQTRALLQAAERAECRLAVNIVNLGEIFYLCVKARNMTYGQRVLQTLHPHIVTISAHDELVMLAATLKARHRISYGDGFAMATAIVQQAPLVTGDPEIKAIAGSERDLKLHWIGRS